MKKNKKCTLKYEELKSAISKINKSKIKSYSLFDICKINCSPDYFRTPFFAYVFLLANQNG